MVGKNKHFQFIICIMALFVKNSDDFTVFYKIHIQRRDLPEKKIAELYKNNISIKLIFGERH
jgi:hypothetical protein